MATLSDSLEAIIAAVVDAVKAETDPGGPLAGVKTVTRGDRARPMPALPCIWVVPQPARFEQLTYGEETWSMPISVAALVKSDEPEAGALLSQQLAARARAAALNCRDVIEGADVTDVVSATFDPTARASEKNRTLIWTEATITVTFTVSE